MSRPPATTPAVPTPAAPLSPAEYQAVAARTLAHIEATVDAWLDDDTIDIDAHRSGGMLELVLPNDTRLIVNTQPPLQELWLAARSGGYHYRWLNGAWRDTRNGREFFEVLSECASAQAGQTLQFAPPASAPMPASMPE